MEAYVPVLIVSFCLQLLLPVCILSILMRKDYDSIPEVFHRALNGALWPDYWFSRKENHKIDPYQLIKVPNIICTDILNPVAVIMTFGVTSPPLACAATAMGVMKCVMWIWVINRFFSYGVERCSDEEESLQAHPSFVALSDLRFPLYIVLKSAFWMIFAISALFMLLIYWDITSRVGWDLPLAAFVFTIFLMYVMSVMTISSKNTPEVSREIETVHIAVNPMIEE